MGIFASSGFVGNFDSVYNLEATFPAASNAGRMATISGTTTIYFTSNGISWIPMTSDIVLSSHSGLLTASRADTSTYTDVCRIPLNASLDIAGAVFKVSGLFSKNGTAAGWGLAIVRTNRGAAAATGDVIWQTFPASTVLRIEMEAGFSISPDRKSAYLGVQNAIGGTNYTISATSGMGILSSDWTVDSDLVIAVLAQSGDEIVAATLDVVMSPGIARAYPSAVTGAVAAGDSMTQGTGSTGNNSYPTKLAQARGFPVVNYGIGGETASQIRARVVRGASQLRRPHVLWMGRNNVGTATFISDVLTEVETCVQALKAHQGPNAKFLVLSVLPAQTTETVGTTNRTAITTLNAALAAKYGSKYVDILTPLLSGNEIAGANYADGTSGQVHLSNAGYAIVATTVSAATVTQGW